MRTSRLARNWEARGEKLDAGLELLSKAKSNEGFSKGKAINL